MATAIMQNPEARPENHELRTFGLIMGAMIVLVFGLLIPWIWDLGWSPWPWAIAAGFAIWALAHPQSLYPVYSIWMKIGGVLGWINTRLILGLAFFALFFPMGMIMRAVMKDPMARKFEPERDSYRVPKQTRDNKHMENPY